jgi:vacuolar-type H+-ATPase subunit B/Vma2
VTTTLEVIDTAVKIGLGALISGVTTYLATSRSQTHEIHKLHISERKELLRTAATKLEASMSMVNHSFQEFTHLSIGMTSPEEKKPVDLIRGFTNAYNEGKEARTLFFLIGNKRLGELVTEYLNLVEELRYYYLSYSRTSDPSLPNTNAVARMKVRDKRHEELNVAFERVYA